MHVYAKWFRRVVIVGILVNLFFALPGTFWPAAVLNWFSIDPGNEPIWPAFAALLLMLLSMFYIPAAADPVRYEAIAWLTVLSRIASALFFFALWREYPFLGSVDLTLGLTQGVLLYLTLRQRSNEPD